MIAEVDGGFAEEIAILGVIHLTSHRLTFHASLLSFRPDVLPSQQVIRSGPATIYRKSRIGRTKKHKVWTELSHDMFTSYRSSSDADRVRPIKAIALSRVKAVKPISTTHPRTIFFVVKSPNTEETYIQPIEYDTEESAQEWYRESTGALYLFHESAGVRIGIPLSRIVGIERSLYLDQMNVAVLQLVKLNRPRLSRYASHTNPSTPPYSPNARPVSPVRGSKRTSTIGTLAEDEKDKDREGEPPEIVVDFGSLTFVERSFDSASPTRADRKLSEELAFRNVFGIPQEEELFITRARIKRIQICAGGVLGITARFICYWTKSPGSKNYRYYTCKLKRAIPVRSKGLAIEMEGQDRLSFTFTKQSARDETIERLELIRSQIEEKCATNPTTSPMTPPLTTTFSNSGTIVTSPGSGATIMSSPLNILLRPGMPKLINVPRVLQPMESKHFCFLTIGSRGDVQPYIALGLGLKREGHRVTIVTHEEYKAWITGWGLEHRTAGGDPGALMKLSVEHKMFSPAFFKESLGNFRQWLDELLVDSWHQCRDADVLIESPSAMAGVHIAEALNIPYFRAFTMPWSKTSEFPHAFISPPVESPAFNSGTYILFDNVFWVASRGQINRWRKNVLQIPPTDMGHMAQSKIPFLYNFSTAVVPKPLDWRDDTVVTGYWFLDNPELNWTPPADLIQFLAKAREDGKPIVYIGFGSITVPRPAAMTRSIIKAVLKADVRAIVSKGWSARMSKEDDVEIEFPDECYPIDKLPHDWLFPQIDAALHHGGAGTTGASLRAGIPTLIKPWFGYVLLFQSSSKCDLDFDNSDQYFWASRVQKLGAGLRVPSLASSDLADVLRKATTDRYVLMHADGSCRVIKEKAAAVGRRIRSEDGVHTAIDAIYTYLPRAAKPRADL
ncbi:UDP-Glycosyltransferase/glycogen phosphorylase [Sistotremastrum niveocremeum HHB9708]|uniref:sterol 3beta-glucosyltransferase n=1 Tax=Sistotremastrum niveocremeum HHB9708 TaxID=1314777 RepID=A0A164T6V7_9AGAM|nr:UDP-Glycosyltransferase/glycogen phosphorylase [Sistotremastrum niveocremeum HHB9708]